MFTLLLHLSKHKEVMYNDECRLLFSHGTRAETGLQDDARPSPPQTWPSPTPPFESTLSVLSPQPFPPCSTVLPCLPGRFHLGRAPAAIGRCQVWAGGCQLHWSTLEKFGNSEDAAFLTGWTCMGLDPLQLVSVWGSIFQLLYSPWIKISSAGMICFHIFCEHMKCLEKLQVLQVRL